MTEPRLVLVRIELVVPSAEVASVELFLRELSQRHALYRLRIDSHPPDGVVYELPPGLASALTVPAPTSAPGTDG